MAEMIKVGVMKYGTEKEYEYIDVEEGTRLMELVPRFEAEHDSQIVLAKLNNAPADLRTKIYESCVVEFLDLSCPASRLTYQASVFFMLLACQWMIDERDLSIKYSMNSGLYIEPTDGSVLGKTNVLALDAMVGAYIKANIPFKRSKQVEGRSKKNKEGIKVSREKDDNAVLNKDRGRVMAWYLEDFRAYFYDQLVPSTGYIKNYGLIPFDRGFILRVPHFTDPHKLPDLRDEEKLFEVFREADEWGKLLGISTTADLNKKIRNGEWRDIVQVSDALHEKKIAQIADDIKSKGKRIILIAGPSSSGKTTFAQRLCVQLRVNGLKPLYMGTDDYFVEREHTPLDENGKFDFESLDAVDLELFNSNMNDLLGGREVDLPVFDFITGSKRYGERVTKAAQDQPIVIEGIHALNGRLTAQIDEQEKYRIYISPFAPICIDRHNRIPVTDTRLLRRIARDNRSRGYSAEKTIEGWPSVRKGEDRNIFPYVGEADVFFNSILIYEIAAMKAVVEPLLEEIPQTSDSYAEARRLMTLLKDVVPMPDDALVLNNSIIREFIGGSILVK